MLSFLARRVPRSKTSHLNIITFEGGHSTADFKAPSDRYLVINRLPPALSDTEAQHKGLPHKGANSTLAPPLHRHLWQEETFHVLSGTARFALGSGRQRRHRLASAGEVAVIPGGQVHTFCNASEEAELVVEFVLDPASRETDEAYFHPVLSGRNLALVLKYTLTMHPVQEMCGDTRDDCAKAGVQRSLFQTLLFMHRGGLVMALPGPDIISKRLGLLFTYVGGVLIGRFLLGYKDSYSEYYHPKSRPH
ncbi:hypothetical protein VP1G_01100 [Cytospora mali]|uniref:Cupin type-2 domain-containing protein n=1 Tax=Cytospora mali TaxID=578113 RepID=A0A194UPU6_CYTMA|nr:hypothetical protein VP1G_01100 [Valsa mali var. pyri (nom. inval.)]